MRYRKLTATGDYTFGRGSQNFLVNSPECVAQAVLTALRLLRGEVFTDTTAGVPYITEVVGNNPKDLYDQVIQTAILNVQGVKSIITYNSVLHPNRELDITATIDTIYSGPNGSQATLELFGYGLGPYGRRPYSH